MPSLQERLSILWQIAVQRNGTNRSMSITFLCSIRLFVSIWTLKLILCLTADIQTFISFLSSLPNSWCVMMSLYLTTLTSHIWMTDRMNWLLFRLSLVSLLILCQKRKKVVPEALANFSKKTRVSEYIFRDCIVFNIVKEKKYKPLY